LKIWGRSGFDSMIEVLNTAPGDDLPSILADKAEYAMAA
tara:strand:+ start:424 stop:540 length:117 start_codon:yes stop_codon:yes gene_type:complete